MLQGIDDWLLAWQTLIAGVLALVGALGTIVFLYRQSQTEAEKKRNAYKATLPLALDALHLYVIHSIRWLKGVREKAGLLESGAYTSNVSVPTVPRPDNGMIGDLRNCVEHLDIEASRFVTKLLVRMQVQQARIADFADFLENNTIRRDKGRVGLGNNIDEYIADSVELAAYASRLYEYARSEAGTLDTTFNPLMLEQTLKSCQLDATTDTNAWNILSTPYLQRTQNERLGAMSNKDDVESIAEIFG